MESLVPDNTLIRLLTHVYVCLVILKVLFSFCFVRISGLLGFVLLHF